VPIGYHNIDIGDISTIFSIYRPISSHNIENIHISYSMINIGVLQAGQLGTSSHTTVLTNSVESLNDHQINDEVLQIHGGPKNDVTLIAHTFERQTEQYDFWY